VIADLAPGHVDVSHTRRRRQTPIAGCYLLPHAARLMASGVQTLPPPPPIGARKSVAHPHDAAREHGAWSVCQAAPKPNLSRLASCGAIPNPELLSRGVAGCAGDLPLPRLVSLTVSSTPLPSSPFAMRERRPQLMRRTVLARLGGDSITPAAEPALEPSRPPVQIEPRLPDDHHSRQ